MDMIGLGPMAMNGGAAAGIEFIASATSYGTTITIPGAAQAGDLAVLFQEASGSSPAPPTAVIPAGFSQIGTDLLYSTIGRISIAQATLAGTPGGTSITGMNGSDGDSKILLVFRGTAGTWAAAASKNQQIILGTGSISNQTISAGAPPYVVLAYYRGSSAPVRGFTPSEDGEISLNPTFVKYKIFNGAAASVLATSDAASGSLRALASFRIGE